MRRALLLAALLAACPFAARAQQIDLSHGGQVTVTARGGFDWNQKAQTVTAYDQAQAVRGGVTVTADRLIAFYRKKKGAASATPASATPASSAPSPAAASGKQGSGLPGDDSSANEIYRLEAVGHVHIFTATQQAFGDHGIYDIDQAVMVLTGHDLHMITPQDVLTARDQMEYWSQTRMSVGRGDATVTTNDGRRIRADVLVGYSAPPDQTKNAPTRPAGGKADASSGSQTQGQNQGQDPVGSTGKLKLVHAFGHVIVRTQTETVTGDRGVYVPDTGIARIVGHVHITRGQNQINGAAAIVNMHTGIATMTENPGTRVQGLIVPNAPGSSTSGGPSGTGAGSGGGGSAAGAPKAGQ